MATLAAVRDAIVTTVAAAVTSLTVYDTIPGVTNLPALVISPASADFNVTMGRGTDTWQFDLFVMVAVPTEDLAQDALDGYVTGAGANSIRAAVFAARTLGLADTNAHVSAMTNYNISFPGAGIDHMAATLRLVVHTLGTA